jgi:hypothetical protein
MTNTNNNQGSEVTINTYSMQEITNIFGDIDEKIASLHSCSSEDFLTLNAYFKKYFTDSKSISDNAKSLFEIITHAENKTIIFNKLNNFQTCVQDLFSRCESFQEQIILAFDKMIQEMEQMFVTANNLKQDLMTLKLLVTNLKIDITISSPSERMTRKANDFNELIVQTKSFFIEFFKNSNEFKNLLKTTNSQLCQYRDRNSQNFNDLLTEIKHSISLLDQKYDEATQLIPKLSESTQNTSSSIAKIVTNLQYQDIIRQKIDHIQQTHHEILKELKELNGTDTANQNEISLKHLLQIRDVAGLQASQLIHTNKEYQKAIEIITTKFLEVGQQMTQISDLCNQISGAGPSNKYSHFDIIREKFEKSSFFSEMLNKSFIFSEDKIAIADKQFQNIYNNYLELSDFVKTIQKSINKSIDNTPIDNSGADNSESTANQINNILSEINEINCQYQNQFEKIDLLSNSISLKNADQNSNVVALTDTMKTLTKHNIDIIENLNTANEKIYSLVTENHVLSTRISSDIKSSIEQIKYYDFFDKVIEEIITRLNEINQKLRDLEGAGASSIDYLKERYTMQSEHLIHDSLSGHNDISLDNIGSTGADEDDDNLELF